MENKKTTRPIDRTKASNRRCVNCIHWKDAAPAKAEAEWSNQFQGIIVKDRICPETGEGINYWNCCKQFAWDPEKEYTTPMPIAQPEVMSDAALEPLIGQPVSILAGRNRLYGVLTSTTAFDLMIGGAIIPRCCKAAKLMSDGHTAVDRAMVKTIELAP